MISGLRDQRECRPWSATAIRLACVGALAAFALAGCREDPAAPQVAGWALVDASQRHPIIVSQQPQSIELVVGASTRGLTPAQRADLLEFTNHARASDAGNSRLVIAAPAGAPNEVAAMSAVGEIRQILSDNGFPEASIAVEGYRADSGRSPIRVSYLRYVAEGPTCGAWPTNLAEQRDNLAYPNFGCANQKNLAAMVANPADLLGPRTESDRSGERRDTVWGKYVKGEHTGADKPGDKADRTDVNADTKSD